MNPEEIFLKNINIVKRTKGIKEHQIAKKLRLDRSTINYSLHGKTRITLNRAFELCDALGVSFFEMMSGNMEG